MLKLNPYSRAILPRMGPQQIYSPAGNADGIKIGIWQCIKDSDREEHLNLNLPLTASARNRNPLKFIKGPSSDYCGCNIFTPALQQKVHNQLNNANSKNNTIVPKRVCRDLCLIAILIKVSLT